MSQTTAYYSSQGSASRKRARYGNRPGPIKLIRKKQALWKGNPRQVAMKTDRAGHTVVMRAINTVGWNPALGLSGLSTDMVFGTTQANMVYSQGGAAWINVAYDNAAACAALFSTWRVKKMTLDIYYTSSSPAQTAVAPTSVAPLLYCVVDSDANNGIANVAEALSYSNMKIMQFGTASDPGGRQSITMNLPPCSFGADTTATFAGTIVTASVSKNKWLETRATNIEHGFFKLLCPAPPIAPNAIVGYFEFFITTVFEYRGIS